MAFITTGNPYPQKRYPILIYLMGCIFLTCLFSCKQTSSPPIANLIPLFDTTNHLYDILPARGIRYIDSAMAKQKNVDIADRFEFYRLHCFFHFATTHNLKKALLYADSMETLIESTHNEKKYAKQYGIAAFSKGDVLFNLELYNEAYSYYYKGKIIGRDNFDNCAMGDYSYHMGMIMYKQEHYKVAATHFIQSFEESKTCNDNFVSFYRNQELLDNTALSYKKALMPNHAEVYYNKALTYINSQAPGYLDRSNTIEVARSVVYGNLAKIYIERKDFAKAETLLKKSIETNLKKGNDNHDAELTELTLAHLYAESNKTALFFALLKTIRTQLDTLKNTNAEVDWNHLMAGYYQKKNDLKKAIQYFNAYDAMKDSVTKADLRLKESDVNEQFKELENQSTISTLKSDNQIQHMYLIVAFIYAVMALVIILLVFLTWKRSKNNVKILSNFNKTVTEQKQKLETSLSELEDNGKEKDRILRAVSHDLRNPIGGIASLTAMMLMEPGLEPEQIELLQLIQTTTNNSLELINEILEATGVLSSQKVNKQYVDINVLLSHSVELLRFKAAEKNQKIMLDVLDSPEELYISREKIWRVLSNLISNAIKFSPLGSVIRVKITLENGGDIRISVNDHGIGIPDEIKNEVFQMFTEAKRPGTAGEKSFGLGLSISKQIIESHNGEIWFESNPTNGTTFYVRLKK